MKDSRHDDHVDRQKTAERLEWQSPDLETAGSIVERTHGPSGGSIDALVGGSGGFEEDGTVPPLS